MVLAIVVGESCVLASDDGGDSRRGGAEKALSVASVDGGDADMARGGGSSVQGALADIVLARVHRRHHGRDHCWRPVRLVAVGWHGGQRCRRRGR